MKKAVNYCMKHDILKEFFRSNSTEVMSMLSLSLTFEDALALRFEEGFEDGMERGMEKGWEEGKEAVARNALAEGVSIDMIQKITGLNMETIKNLQEQAL
ncbi:MAG: hypothetical protein LBH44_04325, partial [Treponema sp.]|jgi:predicted transposase/invertase (TIGR01784 family)|nr:hypothetical protein [Treponema sp.]